VAKQKTAQEYLIKSKLYRFVSLLFVTLGVFVFCVMYIKNVEGRMLEALRDPMIITVFLVPFLPAAILTMMADSAEKKYKKMIGDNNASGTPPKK
jgi:hypothetical protein